MGRRVALLLLAALGIAGAVQAGLPKEAGLSAGVLGQWDKVLDRIPAGKAGDRAQSYFRAVALLESGRTREALAALGDLTGAKGGFAGAAQEKLLEYAFDLGRYDDAIRIAGTAPPQKFLDADAYHYRHGQSLFLRKRYEEAKEPLAKVQGGKWKAYARHSLALIAFASGDPGAAIERLGEALDAAQGHPDRGVRRALVDRFRLLRGRIIRQASLEAGELDKDRRAKLLKVAVSQLALIREDSPLYGEALRTLGWCALEIGDTTRALADFDMASAVDPARIYEDEWASGRVFERLGYFDEAASAYAEARESALEQARLLEEKSRGNLDIPSGRESAAWRILSGRLAKLGAAADELAWEAFVGRGAAEARSGRLDKAEAALGGLDTEIGDMAGELAVLDKGLYHYLDVIPSRALFPKAERPRIDALLDRQDFLYGEIDKEEDALMGLERTRAWTRSTEERRLRAEALWKRLQNASYVLSKAQLTFLEGVKTRVSVREKELIRLVDARKQESASLRDPLKENREILKAERERLTAFGAKLDALQGRLNAARAKVADMDQKVRGAVEARYRDGIAREGRGAKTRADEFALDEAQALHRFEEAGKGAK